jgi:hypothetical protein
MNEDVGYLFVTIATKFMKRALEKDGYLHNGTPILHKIQKEVDTDE